MQNGRNADLQNSRTSSRYRKLLLRSVTRKSPVPARVMWNKRGYLQMDPSLRREIVEYVRYCYVEEGGIVVTLRDLLEYFRSHAEVTHKLSRYAIYTAFPDGMRQICQEAGVPVIEERYRLAAGPGVKWKTAKPSSGKGIGGGAADLEKAVFAELRKGVQPVEIVEQVLRLAKIFKQA
ncbi:MAG: hypothetical protein ABSA81_01870 [Candidatus Bathyarchaeia archaeon]